MSRLLGLSMAAFTVAVVAFWSAMLSNPPKTEAEPVAKFGISEQAQPDISSTRTCAVTPMGDVTHCL